MNIRDLDSWTTEELIKKGRSNRDLLFKRKKRLIEASANNPGKYSPFGLKELEKGIPEISTKMGRNTLKASVMKSERLRNMKTTTARGAKKHQEEMTRIMINVPKEGRLTASQKREYDSATKRISQDSDAMSYYWKTFDVYKRESQARMLPSKELLELFTPTYDKLRASGYDKLNDLFSIMGDVAKEEYEEHARENDTLERIGREGGFI